MKNQLLIAVPIVWTNENFTEGKKSLEPTEDVHICLFVIKN